MAPCKQTMRKRCGGKTPQCHSTSRGSRDDVADSRAMQRHALSLEHQAAAPDLPAWLGPSRACPCMVVGSYRRGQLGQLPGRQVRSSAQGAGLHRLLEQLGQLLAGPGGMGREPDARRLLRCHACMWRTGVSTASLFAEVSMPMWMLRQCVQPCAGLHVAQAVSTASDSLSGCRNMPCKSLGLGNGGVPAGSCAPWPSPLLAHSEPGQASS